MRAIVPEDLTRAARALPDNSRLTLPWVTRIRLWARKGSMGDAIDRAIACGAPEAAVRIAKAPVGALTTQSPGYVHAVSAFADSIRPQSVFFEILGANAFVKVPLRTRVLFTPTPPVGGVVAEGAAKPLAAVQVATLTLEPVKAVSPPVVVSSEMLNDVGAAGQQFFVRQVQAAVAQAADAAFLDMVTSTGTTATASGGTAATNAYKDLRAALLLGAAAGAGRLFWAAAVDVASKAASLSDAAGAPAFPGMGPEGGSLVNLPCIASAGIPAGELVLIDGSGIAANADTIETRISTQADLLMSTTPNMSSATPTPAQMTSLWQTNSSAFVAEVVLAAQVLRDDAVVKITNINWGA